MLCVTAATSVPARHICCEGLTKNAGPVVACLLHAPECLCSLCYVQRCAHHQSPTLVFLTCCYRIFLTNDVQRDSSPDRQSFATKVIILRFCLHSGSRRFSGPVPPYPGSSLVQYTAVCCAVLLEQDQTELSVKGFHPSFRTHSQSGSEPKLLCSSLKAIAD